MSQYNEFEVSFADRSGARAVIVLAGETGEGKTFSALQLAYGMAGFDASKVLVADTESKRATWYDKALKDAGGNVVRWKHLNFIPPFSPERYIRMLHYAATQGVEVVVVDSGSHVWEGLGGCEEIANNVPAGKKANWNLAKAEHKRWVNTLLSCGFHVIVCLRAREKVKMLPNGSYQSLGVQPICEKNFMFEASASMFIQNQGKRQVHIKMPEDLKPIIGRNDGYLTAQDGAALRAHLEGSNPLDFRVETYRHRLISVCERGEEFIRDAWNKVKPEIKTALGDNFLGVLISSAREFDKTRAATKTNADLLNEESEEVVENE